MKKIMGVFLILIMMTQSGCEVKNDIECGANQTLKNDICVDIEVPTTPVCNEGYLLVGDDCVLKEEPVKEILIGDEYVNVLDIINGIDHTMSLDNTEIDSKTDVLEVLNNVIPKVEDTVKSKTTEINTGEDIDYPIVRSELDYDMNKRLPYQPIHNTLKSHSFDLRRILDDVNVNESFVEDEWIMLNPNNSYASAMYKLYINNGELHYYYYCLYNDYHEDQIYAIEGTISNEDNLLEYSINNLSYFPESNTFDRAYHSNFKENDSFEEEILYYDEGEISYSFLLQYNYITDSFSQIELDNTVRDVSSKKLKGYIAESGLRYEISYENDIEEYLFITKFNEEDQYLFNTVRQKSRYDTTYSLAYDFNLLLINGWDTLDKQNSEFLLYSDSTLIDISGNTHVFVSPYGGFRVTGYMEETDSTDDFNLSGTTLLPPITYQELVQLESTIRTDTTELYQDFYTNNLENPAEEISNTRDLFNDNNFYLLYMNKLDSEFNN